METERGREEEWGTGMLNWQMCFILKALLNFNESKANTQNARDKQSVSFAKSSSGIVSQFKEPQPIVIKGELQPASLHNLTCTRIRIPLNAASAAAFLSSFSLHIRISPTTQHFALNLPHIRSRIRILLCSQRVSYFILLHLHSTTATSPFVLFRSLPSFPLPHSHSHAPYPTL